MNPTFAAGYFYRGCVLEMEADELNYKRFSADYTKAVALDPKFVEAYLRRDQTTFRNDYINGKSKDAPIAPAPSPLIRNRRTRCIITVCGQQLRRKGSTISAGH